MMTSESCPGPLLAAIMADRLCVFSPVVPRDRRFRPSLKSRSLAPVPQQPLSSLPQPTARMTRMTGFKLTPSSLRT